MRDFDLQFGVRTAFGGRWDFVRAPEKAFARTCWWTKPLQAGVRRTWARMSQHGSAPARLSTSTAPAPALGLRWRWPALGSQHAALGAGNSCAGARLRWRWSALALGRSALALGIPALALSCAGAGLRWRWGRSALALGFLRWRWAALPLSSLSQYVPVTTVQFQFSFWPVSLSTMFRSQLFPQTVGIKISKFPGLELNRSQQSVLTEIQKSPLDGSACGCSSRSQPAGTGGCTVQC